MAAGGRAGPGPGGGADARRLRPGARGRSGCAPRHTAGAAPAHPPSPGEEPAAWAGPGWGRYRPAWSHRTPSASSGRPSGSSGGRRPRRPGREGRERLRPRTAARREQAEGQRWPARGTATLPGADQPPVRPRPARACPGEQPNAGPAGGRAAPAAETQDCHSLASGPRGAACRSYCYAGRCC